MSLSALTIKQPWAHMITRCGKDVENRGWPVPGWRLDELAIHAGARSGWDEGGELSPVARKAWRAWAATLPPMNVTGPLRGESLFITYSAVVALAEGVSCHQAADCRIGREPDGACSPWAAWGQWHWSWKALHILAEPVPCRGYQKLWTVPGDVESAVRAQLEGSTGG